MKKKIKKTEPKVEYFTEEMAKFIFVFQDNYKASKGGNPITKTISLSKRKK